MGVTCYELFCFTMAKIRNAIQHFSVRSSEFVIVLAKSTKMTSCALAERLLQMYCVH